MRQLRIRTNDRSICALFWKSSKLSKPWEMMTQLNSHSLKSCRVLLALCWTLDQKYWPYVGSKLGWGSLFLLGKIYYVRSRIWPNHSWKELFAVNKYSFLTELVAFPHRRKGHWKRYLNKPANLKCLHQGYIGFFFSHLRHFGHRRHAWDSKKADHNYHTFVVQVSCCLMSNHLLSSWS